MPLPRGSPPHLSISRSRLTHKTVGTREGEISPSLVIATSSSKNENDFLHATMAQTPALPPSRKTMSRSTPGQGLIVAGVASARYERASTGFGFSPRSTREKIEQVQVMHSMVDARKMYCARWTVDGIGSQVLLPRRDTLKSPQRVRVRTYLDTVMRHSYGPIFLRCHETAKNLQNVTHISISSRVFAHGLHILQSCLEQNFGMESSRQSGTINGTFKLGLDHWTVGGLAVRVTAAGRPRDAADRYPH